MELLECKEFIHIHCHFSLLIFKENYILIQFEQ